MKIGGDGSDRAWGKHQADEITDDLLKLMRRMKSVLETFALTGGDPVPFASACAASLRAAADGIEAGMSAAGPQTQN